MSYTNESPNVEKDPRSNPTPPPDREPREWPLVAGVAVVALALLLALLYGAWWYFEFGGWFD